MDGNICDTAINLLGFVCVRQDRTAIKEGYGGVAIYVKEDLAFRLRNDINTGGQKCVWIELIRDKCKPALVCCAYRAPDSDFQNFISSLHESMSSVDLEKSARHWSKHAKLRNKVNGSVRTAKSKYYCDMIEEAKGDSGKVWKAVNEACNRNSSSKSIPCIISDGVQHI